MSNPNPNPNIIPGDFGDRTRKGPSPIGTTTLVGLRAADVVLQYSLLARGWAPALLSRLGAAAIAQPLAAPGTASLLGLQPYHALVVALKHVVWVVFVNEQFLPVGGAVMIAAINSLVNAVNTLLSVWAVTSLAPPPPAATPGSSFKTLFSNPVVGLGVGLYVVGILVEAVSEFQRKGFKAEPANKGKPYGGGLFSWATNINYGGFTLWRAGYAMVCAGVPWGVGLGGLIGWDFASRAIPVMDMYCTRRYGQAWVDIKKRTPYRLIPGIY